MLEAVGAEYLATFFETCDRALRPGGRLSLQVITFPDAAYERQLPRRQLDPDLHLPGRPVPVACGRSSGRPGDTALLDHRRDRHRRRLRPDAGRVAEAFLDRLDEVRALGFDERFIRMWDYYLALSEAGFATGLSQDLQIVMEKSRGFDRDPGP